MMDKILILLQVADLANQWPNLKALHDEAMFELNELNTKAAEAQKARVEKEAVAKAEAERRAAAKLAAEVKAQATVGERGRGAAQPNPAHQPQERPYPTSDTQRP